MGAGGGGEGKMPYGAVEYSALSVEKVVMTVREVCFEESSGAAVLVMWRHVSGFCGTRVGEANISTGG